MGVADKFSKVFKNLLPAPFTIAVILTIVTFFLAFFFTEGSGEQNHALELLTYWEKGLWTNSLLIFAVQMMLMLVLGHVLALSKPVNIAINRVVKQCNTTAKAAFIVTFLTIIVSLFNWGLGLIFGAILARKVGESAVAHKVGLNYALIGAAGYSGLMVWHGGISGSALIKAAEPGHIKSLMDGVLTTSQIDVLPNYIPTSDTIFSSMNMTISILLIVLVPLSMYLIAKKKKCNIPILQNSAFSEPIQNEKITGAERLDYFRLPGILLGLLFLSLWFYDKFFRSDQISLNLTPNEINFFLFGSCLLFHGSFHKFLTAVNSAIGGAAGILIQFPLYFGIMAIMKNSGLVTDLSNFFVHISNEVTFPLFTFMSAGLVNIFVPSGGGQWAVQGPIIVKAATDMGLPLYKSILALAYGDEVTNMLQPFWALPLLGITGLRAKQILPYTLYLFLIGSIIFILGLLCF